ncbi:hypothetical protein Angca_000020, partial [Angiostrongylus cantonensis]
CMGSPESTSTTNCNSSEADGERRFKACSQCGILVDANSPAAMESHLRAHKKNDDLKMKLLARYGPEVDFYLVISTILSEKRKRLELYWGMHIYSQRYVCKWCGQVTSTMTELNAHKADVHAMPPFTAKSDRDRILCKRRLHDRGVIALAPSQTHDETEGRHGSVDPSSNDLIFRTTCDQCGLRLVRPSLLIEAPGTCNYKIDVDCERITWTCCDNQYSTRREFLVHRMNNHLNKIGDGPSVGEYDEHQGSLIRNGSIISADSVDMAPDGGICVENPADSSDYIGEMATEPDGSVQVVVPREVIEIDGEFYIMVENDGDLDCQDVGEFTCVQTSGDCVQQLDEVPSQLQLHCDPTISSTDLVQELLVEPVDHNEDEIVTITTITAEQYEQLQLQYGSSLEDMSIIYVDQDDLSKDMLVSDVSETCNSDPSVLYS